MFESSLVDLSRKQPRRLFSLPLAVAVHGVLLGAVGIAQYWSIDTVTAQEIVPPYMVTLPPPPPPAPAGGGRPSRPVAPRPDPAPAPPVVAQPQDVPDEAPAPAPEMASVVAETLGDPGQGGLAVQGSVGPGGSGGPGGPGHGDLPGVQGSMPVDDAPIYLRAGITKPEILDRIEPRYTELARRSHVQGTVIVEAVIDEQGRVRDVKVLKGLPAGLDQSAVDAVRRWLFRPAMMGERPVKVYYSLTVTFRIS